MESPGINLKKYPSCGGTHTAIDLMLELRDEGVSAEAIQDIQCRLADVVRRILVHPRPRTGLEGKFSMEYCLAAAVLDGEVSLRQFEDDMVQRPEIERLIPRIHVEAHPAVKADSKDLLSELTVTLTDGRASPDGPPRRGATRPGRSRRGDPGEVRAMRWPRPGARAGPAILGISSNPLSTYAMSDNSWALCIRAIARRGCRRLAEPSAGLLTPNGK